MSDAFARVKSTIDETELEKVVGGIKPAADLKSPKAQDVDGLEDIPAAAPDAYPTAVNDQ